MCDNLTPLAQCAIRPEPGRTVSYHRKQLIDSAQFCNDVKAKAMWLLSKNERDYALYHSEAYPFCVLFFAALHAGKSIWIAPNNKPAIAEEMVNLHCVLLGQWENAHRFAGQDLGTAELKEINAQTENIIIYTSGSQGQPKKVKKALWQLQNEIDNLERIWGDNIAHSQILGSVSHQHIYGLLFRILWPLAASRCFHSELYLSPESLFSGDATTQTCWVASPAQLKRLDENSPWSALSRLSAIFSSGGHLPEQAAEQINNACGVAVTEIYGSTETGGIAWRKSNLNKNWRTFHDVQLELHADNRVQLSSPYLPIGKPYFLEDQLQFHAEGDFSLLGRVDRIVKIESKRLSLADMEQTLNQHPQTLESHCLVDHGKRDKIAVFAVLTDSGYQQLREIGKAAFIKQLRNYLAHRFEAIVLPRKWLFSNSLPLTAQGKINNRLIVDLLAINKHKLPQIQFVEFKNETHLQLYLFVQAELVYFQGHFPDYPILPGIAQIAWTEYYGKLLFDIEQPFLRMENIKFKKTVSPESQVKLDLHWRPETQKLYFTLSSDTEAHSSGRMVYGAQP